MVAEIIRLNGEYELAGFVDDTASAPDKFLDLAVYHDFEALCAACDVDRTSLIVAIGDCGARMRLAAKAVAQGFTLISAIHPRAVVSNDASIGVGSVVAAGAVVNPGCSIGSNVIVNTGATVDHDCKIADGVHISPGVHLGGWVSVGAGTWLGIGAVVKDRVRIGAGSMIGAGAVVLRTSPTALPRGAFRRKS